MKLNPRFTIAAALILAVFAVLSVALFVPEVQAQDKAQVEAVEAITAPSAGLIDSILVVFADALVGKYGWAAKLFTALGAIAGAIRLVVKPLWAKFVLPGLEQYVASTPEREDDEKLHAFLNHRVTKALLFSLDLIASVKIPTPKKSGA